MAGLAWISRLTPNSTYPEILGPLILIALGMGMSFVPLTLTAVSGVRPTDAGLASALLNTAQQVGGALGLAVLATVAINASRSKAESLAVASHGHLSGSAAAIATTHGYTTAFTAASGLALIGFLISALAIRSPRRESGSGSSVATRGMETAVP